MDSNKTIKKLLIMSNEIDNVLQIRVFKNLQNLAFQYYYAYIKKLSQNEFIL